jgi:hypothetical protein
MLAKISYDNFHLLFVRHIHGLIDQQTEHTTSYFFDNRI